MNDNDKYNNPNAFRSSAKDPFSNSDSSSNSNPFVTEEAPNNNDYMNNSPSPTEDYTNNAETVKPNSPDGLAIASIVIAIFSLCTFCCKYTGIPLAIVAIICGILSKKTNNGRRSGAAIAGIVLGLLGGLLSGVFLLLSMLLNLSYNIIEKILQTLVKWVF